MVHQPDSFTMERSGSIVKLRWNEGVSITLADVVRSGEALQDLTGGDVKGLAVYVRKLVRVDPEARELIIGADIAPKVALICADPVDAVITGFAHQSMSCTRFFSTEEEALEWLQEDDEEHDD